MRRRRRIRARVNGMRIIRSRTLTIVNDLGLHARSAAKLAKLAEAASGRVWITKNGNTADATPTSVFNDLLTVFSSSCAARRLCRSQGQAWLFHCIVLFFRGRIAVARQ